LRGTPRAHPLGVTRPQALLRPAPVGGGGEGARNRSPVLSWLGPGLRFGWVRGSPRALRNGLGQGLFRAGHRVPPGRSCLESADSIRQQTAEPGGHGCLGRSTSTGVDSGVWGSAGGLDHGGFCFRFCFCWPLPGAPRAAGHGRRFRFDNRAGLVRKPVSSSSVVPDRGARKNRARCEETARAVLGGAPTGATRAEDE